MCSDIFPGILLIIWICSTVYLWKRKKEKWTRLLIISSSVAILFCISPLILQGPLFFSFADWLMSGIKYAEYKSSFLESIGGMLGTVLAIFGALWADNELNQKQRNEEDKRKEEEQAQLDAVNARIVYYDFLFVFKQMHEKYDSASQKPENDKLKEFYNSIMNHRILIDDQWIRTVSLLPESIFPDDKRHHIYLIYDYISRIRTTIENCQQGFNDQIVEQAYKCTEDLLKIAPSEYRTKLDNPTAEIAAKQNLSDGVWKDLSNTARILKSSS